MYSVDNRVGSQMILSVVAVTFWGHAGPRRQTNRQTDWKNKHARREGLRGTFGGSVVFFLLSTWGRGGGEKKFIP